MSKLAQFWGWWSTIGTHRYDPQTRTRMIVTTTLATLVAVMTIPYQIFYALWDYDALRVAIWTFSPQVLLYAAVPFLHRFGQNVGAWYLIIVWMCYALLFNWFFGAGSGLQYYFLPGATAGVLVFGGTKPKSSVTALLLGLAGFVISTTFFTQPAPFINVSDTFLTLMYAMSLPFAFIVVFGIVYFATWQTLLAQRALQAEFRRSEDLLYNVLPESIAAQLKANPGQTIARTHDAATILFADIVEFTPLASRLSADEVVGFLNQLFSEFDNLARKHQLEKIKTIGDAFMVAGGMPQPQPDHAERVARFALDMLRATAAFSDRVGQRIELRIGINSGPVVAGVIGNQKLFYDVWGDTVNTAGRMETYGTVQRIQCTRKVRDLLEDAFTFERRGIVEIKGKGPIEVWYLTGERGLRVA